MKRLLLAVPLALLGAVWFWFLILPWPVLLRWRDPDVTSFMEQRVSEAHAAGDTLELRQEWLPLEAISPHLRRAVIIAEDGRFREHHGVDWQALAEELRYDGDNDFSVFDGDDLRAAWQALRYYLSHRDEIRGRSTITQQVAKNLYFSADRSVHRKLKELVVARRLERFLDKDRILEIYLNVAEWGPGIFGAEAAARHYFGVSAGDLTLPQAGSLAATLPHPLTSNPAHRPGRMAWRRDLILSQLRAGGPPRTVPLQPDDPDRDLLGTEVTEPDPPEVELPPPESIAPPAPPTDTAPLPDTAGPLDTLPRSNPPAPAAPGPTGG